jgi:hypothetical protein
VVTVPIYTVLGARLAVGVKVAVTPVRVTDPLTGAPPHVKIKLAVVIVKGSISSLKVTVILLLIATPAAA